MSLSAESGRTVTVDVETAPGTATEDVDYDATTRDAHLPPGRNESHVPRAGQRRRPVEGDETFDAVLSNPTNATIEPAASATGTIEDDDATSNADLMLTKFDLDDPSGVGGELRYSIDAFNERPRRSDGRGAHRRPAERRHARLRDAELRWNL